MSIYEPNHDCTIGKYIKKKFRPPENPLIYTCRKVWTDEPGEEINWRDHDLWRTNFLRRQENLLTGFFSPPGLTYRPTGGDVVDSNELIAEKIQNPLLKKHIQMHSHVENEPDVMPPVEERPPQFVESVECIDTDIVSLAGREKIAAAIKRSKDRICDVKAGLIYDNNLEEEEVDEAPVDEMVLMPLPDLNLISMQAAMNEATEASQSDEDTPPRKCSSVTLKINPDADFVPKPSEFVLRVNSETNVGEDNLLLARLSECSNLPMFGTNLTMPVSGRSAQAKSVNEIIGTKKRINRDQLEYLQCIHDIIITLRNMSIRHLRSKTPLSLLTLRDLKKTFTAEKDRRATQILKLVYDHDRIIETWDDLVSMPTSPAKPTKSLLHLQNTIFKWGRQTKSYRHSLITKMLEQGEMNVEKNQPVWLKVAAEKSIDLFNDRCKKQSEDNTKVAEKALINLNKVKRNAEKEADNELSRLERERVMLFKVKLECFDDRLSGDLLEDRIQIMESRANFITTSPDVEIPPSKWFEELKELTLSIVGTDDAEVLALLNKVGGYSAMAPKTVTYCKGKLCLLVMSLPAFEILRIPMQLAIKFVLEKILLGTPKQFLQWMTYRKLPFIIIPKASRPEHLPDL